MTTLVRLLFICLTPTVCDEQNASAQPDRPITAETAETAAKVSADLITRTDKVFRGDPRRFLFGFAGNAADRFEDAWYSDRDKAGIHIDVLSSHPRVLRDIGIIAEGDQKKRLTFALQQDGRESFFESTRWIVKIWSVEQTADGPVYVVTALLGEGSELGYQSSNIVCHDFITSEKWQISDGDQPPKLLSREKQFSLKEHAAPFEPLPRTRTQLAAVIARAKSLPRLPGMQESPLEHFQRMCGGYLNDDLSVIPVGHARNADVDDALRVQVMREASDTWQRQIDQLKSCTIIIRRETTQWQLQKTTSVSDYRVVHDLGNNSSLVETGDAPEFLIISNNKYWFSVTRPDGSQNNQRVTDARPRKSDAERSLFGSSMTPAIEPYLTFGKPLPDVLNDPQSYLWYRCRRNAEGLIEVVLHATATGKRWPMTLHFDPDRKFALVKWEHAKVFGDGDRGIVHRTSNVLDENGLIVARRKVLERQGQPQHLIEDSFRITPSRSDADLFRLPTYGCPEWPALWPDGKRPEYLRPDQIVDSSPF
ncbi:MAG: hypothetical protein NXI04_23975 [Planctomycetaceae bacterium]|nr:hypothetical protein [Planctomycetaceae bacterium]